MRSSGKVRGMRRQSFTVVAANVNIIKDAPYALRSRLGIDLAQLAWRSVGLRWLIFGDPFARLALFAFDRRDHVTLFVPKVSFQDVENVEHGPDMFLGGCA